MSKTVTVQATVELELSDELLDRFDPYEELVEKRLAERLVRHHLQKLDYDDGVDALLPDVSWTEAS